MHSPVSRAASPAASRARSRAKVLLATTSVAIAAITLAACFDRTTAPPPSLAPVPRHDFLGDANWGANNSAASGSYDGTIDPVRGGAPAAAQPLGPFIYPTFVTANVAGQVRQMPAALPGSNVVREPFVLNDPSFWGSMGIHSGGDTWWPNSYSAVIRVVRPISPFRNDAGGQPYGDGMHCGVGGYMLCWTWAGTAHFDFTRIHVDLTLARSPDTTVWQGTAATFTAGMSQTNFPGNPYPVDMSALQWRWISDSTASDTAACQSTSGRTCTHVFTSSGTMYTAAYVNGEAQQKSVHVDVAIPKLNLSAAKSVLLAPGDSDTFTATGNASTIIQGWSFTPDSTGAQPSVAVGSAWGNCTSNVSICKNMVSQSGTVSVIGTVQGVQLTAKVHVEIVPCPTGDSILDNPAVRLKLDTLWQLARPGSNKNLWRERPMAGYDSSGLVVRILPADPTATPCQTMTFDVVPAPGPKVFDAHPHPFKVGDRLPVACQDTSMHLQSNQYLIYGSTYGGLSEHDWEHGSSDPNHKFPVYTFDVDSVYRGVPGASFQYDSLAQKYVVQNWKNYYTVWPRKGNGCTIVRY